MKPSPKKSATSKVKQRTKSSSSNSGSLASGLSNSVAASGNLGGTAGGSNATSGNQHHHSHHHHHGSAGAHHSHGHHLRNAIGATACGSDTNSGSGNDGHSTSKDKGSYKSFAGFSSRSVKTIWEQHDKQETEVSSDVYTKLAEDTTYKLWELANNIKTYSRHSSGKVTYDLVNQVLKDCDVPPIVGANNEPWDRIEYDGVYFFNSDEVLDLREEYIKDVTMEQSNIPVLTTSWMSESAIAEDLVELYNNLCDAIYIGDEDCFEEAINILIYNPHVPSLMKLFLTKAIEMLGFEYTETTLSRSLQFLEALVRNNHMSHSDLTLELSLLSQIFVNLLLGPPNLVSNKILAATPMNIDLQPQSLGSQLQQPHSINQNGTESSLGSGPPSQSTMDQSMGFNHSTMVPMNILENNLPGPSEDSNNSNSNVTEELLRSIENIKEGPDGIDINNIKDEYEALFSMVQGLGKQEAGEEPGDIVDNFQIKSEFNNEFNSSGTSFIVQQNEPSLMSTEGNFDIKHEVEEKIKPEPIMIEDPDENVSLQMSESTTGEVNNHNSTTLESENIITMICNDYLVDSVSRVIGLCCGKWGFVEQECTFLLVERLQRFFDDKKTIIIDYNWLSRALRALWSVGEFAFRELIPYLEQINPDMVPDFIHPYFNMAGIFLHGKGDIFLYEYLSEICGDGLIPFMFQYEQYLEKKYIKFHRIREKINQRSDIYRLKAKLVLKVQPKPSGHLKPPPTLSDFFPERTEKLIPAIFSGKAGSAVPQPRFNFRFAGCRPIVGSMKTVGFKLRSRAPPPFGASLDSVSSVGIKQNEHKLRSFHSKVVVAHRKLLAPDSNICPAQHVFCHGSTIL
ncbi:uncharacterized protein LOC129743658 [Uranotaenia lowii]|uniref:uncharacterized protein LOC129743658 n=1 Tax=Uranotaenia lowii TaxID=190385 RepID=UPI002479B541|nr:uncharacterized protein LOC129743658 [Uranotaenia lowii]